LEEALSIKERQVDFGKEKKEKKNTLSNLLTYYLSLCPILIGVANRLEKL
jgi:hypothetical protein